MDPQTCDVAHGAVDGDVGPRRLVVVYASPLATHLLHWASELGFTTELVEPDPSVDDVTARQADRVTSVPDDAGVDATTDVVVTDHHRDDLGEVMAPLLAAGPRWIGIIGSARHEGPHREALRRVGVDESTIATVRRPIGLPIGSRTPAEIALSILAGLVADRNL